MSDTSATHSIDFVRLNEHAIRVTSWREGDIHGTYTMVAITRGSRDAELLDDLLADESLTLDLEGRARIPVSVGAVDRREVGSGQGAVTRFSVTFQTEEGRAPKPVVAPSSLEDRVAALEAEVARLRTELRDIASRTRAD